jgi:asparagine synthase (glutamine-hydrolysing)
MCGVAGEIRFDGAEPDLPAVARMTADMHRRGPDGSGVYATGAVALGHRRLKILDLSERGAQPMVDPELGLVAVFNGLIYNYRELRAELEAAGYRFFSTSDTEVLLKAFHRWGPACVERFLGMFAFGIVERDTGVLTLGRDRLGIKPLYVTEAPGRLRFASSLPALLAGGGVDTSIDPVALHHYMTFHSVVPAPRTILAAARHRPHGPARRQLRRPRVLAARARPPPRARRHERPRLERGRAGGAAGRGAAADGRGRPGGRVAVRGP